ncbi:hypothetical protein Sfum_2482 [Syntrophobacter fumaroxidans MPOB]|uniref:Uncharacterized protein n=2 Tax=Syntrophobacter TaxID=29526 RepID=A0LL60_SYNFM|nr:hypothetical protein Sfum_2482 [Syntrophobacter fumaroxidans MPOB]
MVPVNSTTDFLLADARAALQRWLTFRPQSDLAISFSYWILRRPSDAPETMTIVAEAMQRNGAQQDFQTVATLGFATAAGLLGIDALPRLKQGLDRLAGRQPFVDEVPMSFCSDAVGILGVALGARSLADTFVEVKIAEWLSSFLRIIYHLDGTENWQRWFFHAANGLLGSRIGLSTPQDEHAEDVRVALGARGLLIAEDSQATYEQDQKVLKLVILEGAKEIPCERAAVRLAALECVVRSAPAVVPGRISGTELVHLLERVPAGLRKWTWEIRPRTARAPLRQWHIDHEYHVQNLLCALLAPIFPDLDDEQYLTKIGQKSPRADLYIPSMKFIVETKFIRTGDKMQKVIDEISADASLYNAMGNECAGIIPFIWDDSARSQEHDYLRQGLRKLPGIIDAVIVSRPSDWDRRVQPMKPK